MGYVKLDQVRLGQVQLGELRLGLGYIGLHLVVFNRLVEATRGYILVVQTASGQAVFEKVSLGRDLSFC